MREIDLIALDLDGTALTPGNTVSEATRAAVARARAAGLHVIVSTGRICGEAREFAQQMGAGDLMVTSGGATLSSARDGVCTVRLSIPWEPAVRAAAVVERIGMTAMIYTGERLVLTPYDEREFGRYKSNEGYLAVKQVEPSAAAYIAAGHVPIDKIFVRSRDPIMLQNARRQLARIAGVRVISSAEDNLEILSPIADKGVALGMACRLLGTNLSRAAAIGDSENDLEMLHAVALPVAMGNANDRVKAASRFVTKTNAEEGVAAAIDRILAENGV